MPSPPKVPGPVASGSTMAVPRLIKAALPARARRVLRRMALRARMRGRPFPFVVSPPQYDIALNCAVAYNEYGAYCVPVSGLRAMSALSVLAGDVWEPDTLHFMMDRCKGGDIVHAGAFFGDFLPALAGALGAGGKVWAFEPHPGSYRCASITVQLNQLTNVHLANVGLGEAGGSQLLVTNDRRGNGLGGLSRIVPSAAHVGWRMGNRAVTAQIVAIDDVVPEGRRVSIIHLDVEGYEERALSGALRTIRSWLPILVVETVPSDDWMREHLQRLGYRFTRTLDCNLVLGPA